MNFINSNGKKSTSNIQYNKRYLFGLIAVLMIGVSSNSLSATFTYTPTSIVPASGALLDNGCGTNNGVTITFNVPDTYIVSDVDLGINITHTYRGDLFMELSSPAGTGPNQLFIGNGGNGSNNFNVLFDDSSLTTIPTGNHNIIPLYDNVGEPQPDGNLDAFNTESSNGAWTLFVCDRFNNDLGAVTDIELRLTDTPPTFSLDVIKSSPTIPPSVTPVTTANHGDVLQYSVIATNTGTGTQTNVLVSDPLLTPSSNTCASVAAGGTCTLTGTYTVTSTDRQNGEFSNTASAESDQVTSLNSNTVTISVDPQLTVVKAQTSYIDNDVNGYISVGDVLNYTVTATNTGDSVNILVTDPILTPNSKSCLNVNTSFSCVLSGTYQVLAQDKLAGNILNTGAASVNGGSSVESNTVHVVVGENPVADAESVFYMPLPEDQALTALQSIFPDPAGGPSPISGETCGGSTPPQNPISTYSSITVLRSNTLIYYDHYEDGYEVAPNASAQSTTEVWGDGDISNGTAPGNSCLVDSCDVLEAGIIIVLDNQIDTSITIDPLNPPFNGGDKISATDTIAMTKANWSTGPDTLLAGAFELYPTTEWGTTYEIPVGQNVFAGNNAKYQYVGITIMAQADGTTGTVDRDGNPGTTGDQTAFSLDEGESIFIDGNILVGATVTASDLIQVDIVTGDICANYEARFITLFPSELWDNSYYNPVGTNAGDNAPVRVLLYNPDHSNPITVLVLDSFGSTTVSVAAGSFVDYLQTSSTAARYCTTTDNVTCDENGSQFYAIAAIDADPDSTTGQTSSREDWGLTLVPTSSLSQQVLLGLGFGQDPLLPVTENSSPVWVTADLISGTPTNGIQLCVDYDNDGTDAFYSATPLTDPVTGQEYDERFTVDPYERTILYDYDGDQTSMLVWVCETDALDAANAVIAAAWGQDPDVSSAGAPAVDVGTGIPNVSSIILLKEGELVNDLNGDGYPSIGDTIRYKISLTNIGFVPVSPGAVLTDTLPTNVSYVEDSTLYFNSVTTTVIPDDSVPPNSTEFPLDEAGVSLNDLLAVGNSFLVTFDVVVVSLPPADVEICNNANINVPFESVSDEFCIDIVPRTASIGDFVWNDLNNNGLQDDGPTSGIEGVTVTLVDLAGNPVLDGLSNVITTTTAADGSWSLTNLPIGNYRVLFDTATSTDGLNYVLTSPNQGGNDAVDSDGQANGVSGQSLTSIFTLSDGQIDLTIDAGFIESTIIASSDLCYAVTDTGDRLVSVNPISGQTIDVGGIPFANVETIVWDLGDPLVFGDEILYASHQNTTPNPDVSELVQLLPGSGTVIGNFSTLSGGGASGITDSDGFAIDWQSVPPVYYASGDAGSGHLRLFDYDPSNAEVLNLSPDITLPVTNTQIDDIAWDPINRRLVAVTNDGATNSHIVEFDLSSYPASVTAYDCGLIVYDHDGNSITAPVVLEDTEGLTYHRTGELYISTGAAGSAASQDSLWKISIDDIRPDCSVGPITDLLVERIGPANTFANVPSAGITGDTESLACGITFIDSNASIGNRVWLDEDSDGLQSAGEDGVGDVTVYLCRANASPCDVTTAIRTEVTDANGGYMFEGLPLMDYIVAVNTSSLPSNLAANPTYDEDDGTTSPNHQTTVSLNRFEHEHLTADFGYNWNNYPETETPPPATTGSIGDRVWNDSNGNGIQDDDEIGLNTVDVLLYSDPDNNGVFDTFVISTTTNDNGNYVFDGLAAGAYVVRVVPSTLPVGVTWTQTGDPDEFAQLATNPDNMTTSPIILAPGDVYVNADFGYQGDALNTHDIGDTVYLDTNADGNEDVGEPGIPNVTVSLIDSVGNTIARTVTDENGNYLFSGLPDGNYTVKITDNYNVLAEKEQSGDPDATLDNQSSVIISGSDNFSLDFGYIPEGHTNGAGLIGDTIFLDIDGIGGQSAGEPGIEGVRVELISIANGGYPIDVTYTDENGNYQFGNLTAGDYIVRVDTSTLPNGGTGMTNSFDPDGSTSNESNVTLVVGEINLDQDFGYNVTVPNTIGGTLWNDSDADGTLDGTESQRFAGVTINLLDTLGNVVASTVTDANGDYQFTGLPDGTYTVSITDDGNVLAGHWLTDGLADGLDSNSQVVDYTISVSGGATNTTADFGYYVNLASVGNIVYRDDDFDGVRDSVNEPGIPNVPVTLTITYPNSDVVYLTVYTDDAGSYSFNNLLADDSYTGDDFGGTVPQPVYSIAVGSIGSGYISSYDGIADATGIGNGTDDNSDNDFGEVAYPIQGGQDFTNDFGFAPAAVIGDRVWLDSDNDGIQDANEDGISNITISLLPPPGINLGNGSGVAITTITDSEGNYLFPNIPVASGYVVTLLTPPVGLSQSFDEDGTGTPHSSVVNLTSGNQEYLTADFGYTPSSGSVGDYIWADVNGDGEQDTNEIGIPGVTVELFNLTDGISIGTTTTDNTGKYLFTGQPLDKTFEVRVIAGIPSGYIQTGDPDGVGAPDNMTQVPRLNTSNGFNLNADFGYQPPVANHFDIGDTVYIDLNGDGSQQGGEPGVEGITIHLLIDSNNDNVPDTAIASTETDSNGNYLFPSLPEGQDYGVVVTDTQNILNNFIQTDDPDPFFDGRSVVLNLTADNLNQDFGYISSTRDTGVIGDFIFNNINGDGVQDPNEPGLEGVRVNLYSNTGILLDSIFTDENGEYLFTGLNPNASYDVVVDQSTLPGGAGVWTNTYDPDAVNDGMSTIDLSLIPGGISLTQDFGFTAPTQNSIGGTVWREDRADGLLTDGSSGTVNELSNGIENVRIIIRDSNGDIVDRQFTDANGDFLFTGLPDGTYSVEVDDVNNVLVNYSHTDGPNAGDNSIDNNSQDDTGYIVTVSAGELNTTADFGYMPIMTTPITLAKFNAYYNSVNGRTTLTWSTLTETGNLGFELYAKIDGLWHRVNNKMVASVNSYSTNLIEYQYVYDGGYIDEWIIADIDVLGKKKTHGPFITNKNYGYEGFYSTQEINWYHINQQHLDKKQQRNSRKAELINSYIESQKQENNEGEWK
jgi:uncharacterized repeat protein (TIGR01451 family)